MIRSSSRTGGGACWRSRNPSRQPPPPTTVHQARAGPVGERRPGFPPAATYIISRHRTTPRLRAARPHRSLLSRRRRSPALNRRCRHTGRRCAPQGPARRHFGPRWRPVLVEKVAGDRLTLGTVRGGRDMGTGAYVSRSGRRCLHAIRSPGAAASSPAESPAGAASAAGTAW